MRIAFFGIVLLMSIACSADISFSKDYAQGMLLYQQNCQNCHGAKGEGLRQLIPPLTDSIYLKQHRSQLFGIIKNGLSGTITINGKDYHQAMPAQAHLNEKEIRQLLVYVTNSFGNKQAE